jgi:TonB-dependent receptor
MRLSWRCLFLGAIALLQSAAATAASVTLTGRVRDADTHSFLPGAAIVLREAGRETAADREGAFTVTGLAAGTHTVVVSYVGYADTTQTVTLSSDAGRSVEFALKAEILKLGQFVVEGEREGQARALQQKRTADNILDVVSADSAGKLPDGNAAEAVRRLPGVFAEIDQNEGRYIVVRGIDAALNNITIDGISVGSTESGTRGSAMDAVPADLISRIEVVKAVTPDMDHQAVGASVNIVTPSAFDRGGRFAYGTVAGGVFNGPKTDVPIHLAGTYGQTFGDGKWGLIVGASYKYRHYISNRQSGGNPWLPAGPAGSPGAAIFFPAVDALFHYDVQRWRQGVNAALEYRPDPRHHFALRISDNRFKDEEGREQSNFEFFRTAFPASFTPTTAAFTGGRATVEYRYYRQKHNITNTSFTGKHALGDGRLRLDYLVAVGEANKQTPDRQDWEFRSGTNLTSTVNTSAFHWDLEPGAAYFDAASYPFRRVRFRRDEEEEDNLNTAINLRQTRTLFGREGFVQVGARYFTRDKGWNRDNVNYLAGTGANLFSLSQPGLAKPAFQMFGGYRQMAPQINLAAAQAFFRDNPRYFVSNLDAQIQDSAATDFAMQEKVAAGYAMARANFGRWSALAGVRVERNAGDIKVTDLPFRAGVFQGVRVRDESNSYTNVLPGLHLRFHPDKQWVVRASWTNTLGRPNYPDLAAARSFSFAPDTPGGNVFTGSVSQGNPDLKPYESMNFDLSAERYLKNSGLVSVGVFHKRIDNPVFSRAYTLRNTTYEGMTFSALSFSGPDNADRGKITGLEANYQQQLTMLPSPFNGLGFGVNVTLADSEERLFSRPTEKLRFAKQADTLYNVALSYEKYGFEGRIGYTFTGDYLRSFGASVASDSYQAKRRIIDAKISYRLTKHFRLFADVINLGEEPLTEYAGYPHRMSATEIYWWTANFGVNWRL